MSKFLLVGDLHLDARIGEKRVADFFNTIKSNIIKTVDDTKDLDFIVLMGDYGVDPNTSNYYRTILADFIKNLVKYNKIYALLGQHDRNKEGHVLQPINALLKDKITIIEDVLEIENVTLISHDRDTKALKRKIKETTTDYIFGHFNVNEFDTGTVMIESDIKVDKKKKFYLGDIHKRQKGDNVTYVGSVAPCNLGQLDYDFAILILDTDTGKEEWVPINYMIETVHIEDKVPKFDVNKNYRIIVHIDEPKEKIIWKEKLKNVNYFSLEFSYPEKVIKKEKINLNMNFDNVVETYLKMIEKEYLKDKIFGYMKVTK